MGSPALLREKVASSVHEAIAQLARPRSENPYTTQTQLEETVQSLVGIIRTASELEEAIVRLQR